MKAIIYVVRIFWHFQKLYFIFNARPLKSETLYCVHLTLAYHLADLNSACLNIICASAACTDEGERDERRTPTARCSLLLMCLLMLHAWETGLTRHLKEACNKQNLLSLAKEAACRTVQQYLIII